MDSTAVEKVEPGSVAEVVQRVLASRVTCLDFGSKSLPAGAIERAVQAAIAAPNHRLTEPWRFVRVGVDTREALCQGSGAPEGQRPHPECGYAGARPREAPGTD